MSLVKMAISYPSYLAIRALLWHVRLGDSNVFEEDISELMELMQENEGEDFDEAVEEYGIPTISLEFNDSEGLTINLLEQEQE